MCTISVGTRESRDQSPAMHRIYRPCPFESPYTHGNPPRNLGVVHLAVGQTEKVKTITENSLKNLMVNVV